MCVPPPHAPDDTDLLLQATFDSMGAQTAQMAVLGGELEVAQHLNR